MKNKNYILGIDPGLNNTGWGIVESINNREIYISHGVIKTESKNILGYCNLTWDKNVLRYFENKRRVITVSSAQVREKIYKSSLNSWINYKDDLGNFFKSLK